jgi:hypothetical protein
MSSREWLKAVEVWYFGVVRERNQPSEKESSYLRFAVTIPMITGMKRNGAMLCAFNASSRFAVTYRNVPVIRWDAAFSKKVPFVI